MLGDIESNPGNRKISALKIFHWNLDGPAGHEFPKLSLIEVFINVNDTDIICLSEPFLDSPINENRLSIPGYSMMTADHPSNAKIDGVCLYYKELSPIIQRDDIFYLRECLVTEITLKNERCFLTFLAKVEYRKVEYPFVIFLTFL